ncbi:rhamnosyltransferase WsaF family glycosyltransferase [Achromobacter denitrificans]|uniref:rhamnosyltransferase WsaF family glycosyltransferase n=1 Tax=Achromobacter denitrificans TaxID=32002 RepID=UPI0014659204|nr:hypothetical protein [Achromobacter denitrificans]CAB3829788.1 hypothetical protein LMG1860_01751 [Achromobacter denitrificans]
MSKNSDSSTPIAPHFPAAASTSSPKDRTDGNSVPLTLGSAAETAWYRRELEAAHLRCAELQEQLESRKELPVTIVAPPPGISAVAVQLARRAFHRLRARKRLKRDIKLIIQSPLFDPQAYAEKYLAGADAHVAAAHYAQHWREGLQPGPNFDSAQYLLDHPDVAAANLNPLVHFEVAGRRERRKVSRLGEVVSKAATVAFEQVLQARLAHLGPLRIKDDPSPGLRINVVTDSIGPASLFGGVATALVLAAALAQQKGAQLRLITRNGEGSPEVVNRLLKLNQIEFSGELTMVESAPTSGYYVPVRQTDDVFITTSWWTTCGVRKSISPEQIIYLLQEDERMFYGYGDERLRCEEVISDDGIIFVLNTGLLQRHLTQGPNPIPGLAGRSTYFEPAFPSMRPANEPKTTGKRRFFFYARPNNLRNLYLRGLEVITQALLRGILDPQEWEFHFAGKDLPNGTLPGDPDIYFHQQMEWAEYSALLQTIDIGLTLMDTPHPSYPPLDLACSGAISVTNSSGLKTDLSGYSKNIICTAPTVDALLEGIVQALNIDRDQRNENLRTARIQQDWNSSLAESIEFLSNRIRALHV